MDRELEKWWGEGVGNTRSGQGVVLKCSGSLQEKMKWSEDPRRRGSPLETT